MYKFEKVKMYHNFKNKRETENLRSFLERLWSKYVDYEKILDIHCKIVLVFSI